jgi:hypothetical protein
MGSDGSQSSAKPDRWRSSSSLVTQPDRVTSWWHDVKLDDLNLCCVLEPDECNLNLQSILEFIDPDLCQAGGGAQPSKW